MNNEPQKKKNVDIKRRRNQSSPHQNADAINTMQFSRKFDWILLVEGSSDVKFYSKFAVTFKNFPISSTNCNREQDDFENDKADFLTEVKLSKNEICRQKIVHLITDKIKDEETKHFYGIIDRDFEQPIDTEHIKTTDAHSLETMMIKYIFISDSGLEKLVKIIRKIYKCLSKDEAEKIIINAIQFSIKLGNFRKKYPYDFSYKNNNFYRYIQFAPKDFSFSFRTKDYIEEIVKTSQKQSYDLQSLIDEFEKANSDNENVWLSCHGHNLIGFIKDLVFKSKGIQKEVISTYSIIDDYPTECFENTPIARWLKDIENLKENEEKSLTKPKYRDYIISVGK